jgi:hypothetical protein
MNLWDYEDKRVKIIDIDNRIHVGIVDFYTSELDELDGIACIALIPDGAVGYLTELKEHEIKSIEILKENPKAPAVAV